MSNWQNTKVSACISSTGDRVSVIEQKEDQSPSLKHQAAQNRYVLGNGRVLIKIHDSIFLDTITGEEYTCE